MRHLAATHPVFELESELAEARRRSDALFALVRPDALYDRPIPERNRIIFYVGHLEAFDWNLIGRHGWNEDPFHASFDHLFAFGIDPVDGGLPADQPKDWPGLHEVLSYNARVRDRVDANLREVRDGRAADRAILFHVAVEHRLMHAETLAYMFHQLPFDRKIRPAERRSNPAAPSLSPRMIEIPAGRSTLGLRRGPDSPFGWDNEFEQVVVDVPAFRVDAFNVTNGQFLEFLEADGYEERSLWKPADWEWKAKHGIAHPAFWTQREGTWFYRGMFEERPVPLEAPVYVSHAEASAYALWRGLSLPSEAQFHRAAFGEPGSAERYYPWGDAPADSTRGNFDFAAWGPVAAGSHPGGASAFGVHDLVGNGWEWTSTVFEPFPGFEAFPFYPGYSANFFDGKHYVMKGGSPQTAARLLRPSFRNWFQPHYQYMYAGFRCVEN